MFINVRNWNYQRWMLGNFFRHPTY